MKKVMVVIDMQNDFITGSLGTKEAQQIVPSIAKKITEFDGRLIFTRDTHSEDYLQTAEGKKLPVVHCIKGTEGHEIDKRLVGLRQAEVIDKPTFGSTALAELLKMEYENVVAEGDSMEVELCGVCTDICVVSNALLLRAVMPELEITVDASCCADVTVDSHTAALTTMKMCQINVIE